LKNDVIDPQGPTEEDLSDKSLYPFDEKYHVFRGRLSFSGPREFGDTGGSGIYGFRIVVVHPDNPRYFMVKDDPEKKAIYLTGSHYWYNLQDRFLNDTDPNDYLTWPEYLEFLEKHKHNFVRGWHCENAAGKVSGYSELWTWDPMPFARTGEGKALDGKPKFDLTKYNRRYFDRIRSRAIELDNRGIYISIMLFQGWSVDVKKEGTDME